ncbi:MAG: hypothetical protein NVSMB64_17430 [Candidatus Velthaea sp.]
MKRFMLGLTAAALLAAPAAAQTSGPGPIVNPPIVTPILIPPAPPIANATSSRIFDAALAIGRAQLTDPQAAQNASFAYAMALARYRAGDLGGADVQAVYAIIQAQQSAEVRPGPVPMPPFASPRAPRTSLYGADAPAIDADAFLALTRNQLNECAARKSPALSESKVYYAQAQRDFAARNWQAVRIEAKAAIDACVTPH